MTSYATQFISKGGTALGGLLSIGAFFTAAIVPFERLSTADFAIFAAGFGLVFVTGLALLLFDY